MNFILNLINLCNRPLINSVKMTVSTFLKKECKIYDYHAEKTFFDTEIYRIQESSMIYRHF